MIFYNKTKLSSILAYYILLYPNITFYKSITEYTYFLKKNHSGYFDPSEKV